MIEITENSVSFSGEQALQFDRLHRAMRHLGRTLVMEPGGTYHALDGAALPDEVEITQALDQAATATRRSRLRSITRRQLRLWLHGAGLLDEIPTLIQALPEPQRTTAQIEWEDSTTYDRLHPLVLQFGQALGMTDADLDVAWQHAARL